MMMMTNNDNQQKSIQEQQAQSNLSRRRARQKTIKTILQIIGFPSSGIGFAVTAKLLLSGDVNNGIIVLILSVSVTLIAIVANFLAELCNLVLDKIEAKLAHRTEPLANWIA